MEYTREQFQKCKEEGEYFYSSLTKVRCPYFDDFIHFNVKGLDHLKLKSWDVSRLQNDQYARFRHIKVVPGILSNSKTLQGFDVTKRLERVKINKKWQFVVKNVTYYEFIAVVESHGSLIRVKIIVKQIEGGEKFFYSIIPYWGKGKRNGERHLANGNLEED